MRFTAQTSGCRNVVLYMLLYTNRDCLPSGLPYAPELPKRCAMALGGLRATTVLRVLCGVAVSGVSMPTPAAAQPNSLETGRYGGNRRILRPVPRNEGS